MLMYTNDLDKLFINECINFQSYIYSLENPSKNNIEMNTMLKQNYLEDIYVYMRIA